MQAASVSSGKGEPNCSTAVPPIACSSVLTSIACWAATCRSTRTAVFVTSGPMPSPGRTTILSDLIIPVRCLIRPLYHRTSHECGKFLPGDLHQVSVLDRLDPISERYETLIQSIEMASRKLKPELLGGRIPRTFANAVDRALHLARTCLHRRYRVRNRQAKVIVAMRGHND